LSPKIHYTAAEGTKRPNAATSAVFSSGVPTVKRRQPAHNSTLDRSRTMMLSPTRYVYNARGSLVFTNMKLASEGYTCVTKSNARNVSESFSRSATVVFIHSFTWATPSNAANASSCVAWLMLYGG